MRGFFLFLLLIISLSLNAQNQRIGGKVGANVGQNKSDIRYACDTTTNTTIRLETVNGVECCFVGSVKLEECPDYVEGVCQNEKDLTEVCLLCWEGTKASAEKVTCPALYDYTTDTFDVLGPDLQPYDLTGISYEFIKCDECFQYVLTNGSTYFNSISKIEFCDGDSLLIDPPTNLLDITSTLLDVEAFTQHPTSVLYKFKGRCIKSIYRTSGELTDKQHKLKSSTLNCCQVCTDKDDKICKKSKSLYAVIDNTKTNFTWTMDMQVYFSDGSSTTITQTPTGNFSQQLLQWVGLFETIVKEKCKQSVIEARCNVLPNGCGGLPPPPTEIQGAIPTMKARYLQISECLTCPAITNVEITSINNVALEKARPLVMDYIEGDEVRYELCGACGEQGVLYYENTSITVAEADMPLCLFGCDETFPEKPTTICKFLVEENGCDDLGTEDCEDNEAVTRICDLCDGTITCNYYIEDAEGALIDYNGSNGLIGGFVDCDSCEPILEPTKELTPTGLQACAVVDKEKITIAKYIDIEGNFVWVDCRDANQTCIPTEEVVFIDCACDYDYQTFTMCADPNIQYVLEIEQINNCEDAARNEFYFGTNGTTPLDTTGLNLGSSSFECTHPDGTPCESICYICNEEKEVVTVKPSGGIKTVKGIRSAIKTSESGKTKAVATTKFNCAKGEQLFVKFCGGIVTEVNGEAATSVDTTGFERIDCEAEIKQAETDVCVTNFPEDCATCPPAINYDVVCNDADQTLNGVLVEAGNPIIRSIQTLYLVEDCICIEDFTTTRFYDFNDPSVEFTDEVSFLGACSFEKDEVVKCDANGQEVTVIQISVNLGTSGSVTTTTFYDQNGVPVVPALPLRDCDIKFTEVCGCYWIDGEKTEVKQISFYNSSGTPDSVAYYLMDGLTPFVGQGQFSKSCAYTELCEFTTTTYCYDVSAFSYACSTSTIEIDGETTNLCGSANTGVYATTGDICDTGGIRSENEPTRHPTASNVTCASYPIGSVNSDALDVVSDLSDGCIGGQGQSGIQTAKVLMGADAFGLSGTAPNISLSGDWITGSGIGVGVYDCATSTVLPATSGISTFDQSSCGVDIFNGGAWGTTGAQSWTVNTSSVADLSTLVFYTVVLNPTGDELCNFTVNGNSPSPSSCEVDSEQTLISILNSINGDSFVSEGEGVICVTSETATYGDLTCGGLTSTPTIEEETIFKQIPLVATKGGGGTTTEPTPANYGHSQVCIDGSPMIMLVEADQSITLIDAPLGIEHCCGEDDDTQANLCENVTQLGSGASLSIFGAESSIGGIKYDLADANLVQEIQNCLNNGGVVEIRTDKGSSVINPDFGVFSWNGLTTTFSVEGLGTSLCPDLTHDIFGNGINEYTVFCYPQN